ncbi:flagellar export protein FliJ [Ewingella americana]|jgi:flagellar FliJ protein|uniref:Flagellar FliJ protein n=1 Tax=Ewingella americana TaxID=41202 RepID=A0A502GTK5_9GAMM|nr:flagellar export protein FliJ [Ewingella americana]TPG64748.1 flagella biosynthesis chaperone FliJ [Ewingella americana]
MESSSPLITLCSLAQKALDQATNHLGQIRQSHNQAQEQLSMLLNYQNEYRQKLNTTMTDGIAANTWQNYQQFITTLEVAIDQHRQQLLQWNQRLDAAVNQWQEKQQRLNAYQTLQSRASEQRRQHENRMDQKQTDEFAQRGAHRKKH